MPRSPHPRAAIIGISGYGKIYLERLLHHAGRGELSLAAATVIDRPQTRAACADLEERGARIYDDYRTMLGELSDKLDLVLIPTPIHLHAAMTRDALAAGANVLVEKPIAATVQDVRSIGAASAAAGRFVAVGFQDLYLPDTLEVKRRLLAGAIGRLRRIKGRGLWPRGEAYYTRNNWAGRVRIGEDWVLDSPLANALAHFLNLALFLGGQKEQLSARPTAVEAELYRARPIESYDTAAVRIETAGGVQILFYASHSCESALDPELLIEGEAGRAVWTYASGWRLHGDAAGASALPPRGETVARREMFARVLHRLADPSVFVCGPEIAFEHTLCFNGIQAAVPIRDVPASALASSNGSAQPAIAGIAADVDRAFAAGRLLRESGCPWAGPSGRISLESFAQFPP